MTKQKGSKKGTTARMSQAEIEAANAAREAKKAERVARNNKPGKAAARAAHDEARREAKALQAKAVEAAKAEVKGFDPKAKAEAAAEVTISLQGLSLQEQLETLKAEVAALVVPGLEPAPKAKKAKAKAQPKAEPKAKPQPKAKAEPKAEAVVHQALVTGLGDGPAKAKAEPKAVVLAVLPGEYSSVREAMKARALAELSQDLGQAQAKAYTWASQTLKGVLAQIEAEVREEVQAELAQAEIDAEWAGIEQAAAEAAEEYGLPTEMLVELLADEHRRAEEAEAQAKADAAAKEKAEAEAKAKAEADKAFKVLTDRLAKLAAKAKKAQTAMAELGLSTALLDGVVLKAQAQAKAKTLKEVHLRQVEGQLAKALSELETARKEVKAAEAKAAQAAYEAAAWEWLTSDQSVMQIVKEKRDQLMARGKFSVELSKYYNKYLAEQEKAAAKNRAAAAKTARQELEAQAWSWFQSQGAQFLSTSEYIRLRQLNRMDASITKHYQNFLKKSGN